MIIEPMNIHGKSFVFVHFNPETIVGEDFDRVISQIHNETDHVTTVIAVPGGQPNPQNPMGAYILRESSEAAISAIRKLAKNGGPGALIVLSDAEFEAFTNPNIVERLV